MTNEPSNNELVHLRSEVLRLERYTEDMEQFVYAVSHDLRAPLRGITQLATFIEEDIAEGFTEELSPNIGMLLARVGRMEKLLDALLDYARASVKNLEPNTIKLGDMIGELWEMLSPKESFELRLDVDNIEIETAEVALRQVLQNLLDNALAHHDRDAGCVMVSARRHGEMVRIAVEDDGPGIKPKHRSKIFGIFQSLQPRDQTERLGVGLALVKRLVSEMGGNIGVDGMPDRGVRFTIDWPATWTPREARTTYATKKIRSDA